MSEEILFKKWEGSENPTRVLFIRLQALGDVTITLPYVQGFKKQFPDCQIDFFTRSGVADIAQGIHLFDHVYVLDGGRNTRKQAFSVIRQLPKLLKNNYDVVVDLQNNRISRLVRKMLFPKAWSAFDRYSPTAAGKRTLNTINAVGLEEFGPDFNFRLQNESLGEKLLQQHGWKPDHELVVLNPAGFFETRNWPLANYVKFAELWTQHFEKTQFLMLGIERIKSKADYIQQQLGNKVINLTGLTTPAEAFSVIQKVKLVISEDSGLMHMAWVSGKATVALFGSSRSDWSRPLGEHSICLDSSDLECGECMQATCKFGDVHCLTRHTPEMVFERSAQLIDQLNV